VTDEARGQDRGGGETGRRAASWLAWSLGLLSVALLSASAVLLVLNRPTRVVEGAGVWGTANVPFIVLATALVFTLVGALVASWRPSNPIGWISLAAGLALALFNAAGQYAIYALVSQPGSLPGARVAAWLREWIWVPSAGLIGSFLVLLFPDGRLPSRRSVGQEDGHRVVVGLGEKLAGRRSDHVGSGPSAPDEPGICATWPSDVLLSPRTRVPPGDAQRNPSN
jgi:hypothetical protein